MARNFSGVVAADKIAFSSVYEFTGDQTVAIWFKRDGATHRDILWSRWVNTTTSRQLQIYFLTAGGNNNKIQVDVPFVAAIMTSVTAISDTNWHHCAVTRSGNNWVLYIDGVQDQTATVAATQETGAPLWLGQDEGDITSQTMDGNLAEAAGWSVVLDAAQIAGIAKGFSPRLYPTGLEFYAPLIGKASPEPDIVGGTTGTVTGAVVADHVRVYYPGASSTVSLAASGIVAPDDPHHRLTQEFIEIPISSPATVTYARLTEEFIEVSYRDPLVAGPARLTAEQLEVPYHAELTALVDGPRLTQQTVEILYLEPEAAPVFDDCGHFSGLREWEIRVYDHMDPSTGKRKAFGPDGYDLQSFVQELNFELQERGGYGGGSCELLSGWDEFDLNGTERVDVYLWDSPAYRGYLRIAQKNLNSPESATPHFYGMVAILDQWLVKRKYAYGCETDAATIARDIALDYVQVTGRFPNVSLDMSTTVGATLKEFDGRGKSVAQCFNELADLAPNQVIWGAEMDSGTPIPGDVLYFRPRPTTTAYVVPVGDNVQALVYPVDTHEIVNSLAPLKGGTVSQPNLMLNGSFEELKPANEDNGNLLLNHSFEDDASSHPYWTDIGPDPTVKYSGHSTAHGAARSGNQWAELDESGEGFYQDVQIIPGRRYEASCWARLEDGTISNSGLMELEAYDSGMALVATTSIGLTSLTATYQRFVCDLDLASYPTAETLRVTVSSNGGSAANDGVLVDDVGLYEYCANAQEFWRWTQTGNAVTEDLDWNSEAVTPRTGAYTLHAQMSAIAVTADTGELYILPSQSPTVQPNERYTLIVFWHTNGAGTPAATALTIGGVSIDSSNNQGTVWESDDVVIPATPPTTWQMASFDIVTESDTARFQPFVRLRANIDFYIDDIMLVQGDVPEEVESYGGFWPADTYQRYIDVEDTTYYSATQNFDDLLDTDVADSITDYGEHETEVTNDLVTDRQTALAYAAGQFNAKALPKVEGTLTIFGARQLIFNEGKVRIVNLPDAPSALYPSRSSYTITESAINCVVELGNNRPDLASLLLLTTERARKGLT